VNLIVEHVVEHGLMDPAKLGASPFTDISPTGPEGIFGPARVDALVSALQESRRTRWRRRHNPLSVIS
jgi:type I restriction enzyme R subunit